MKVECVMCDNTAEFDDPPEGGKYICPDCFIKVKEELEKKHPKLKLVSKEPDKHE